MPQKMPKIAIFGGTFDPIHWGHLLIAETAFDQFQLDRVLWVPTFRPLYKAHPLLAFEQRLEMVRRAIADHPAFSVYAIDGQQAGASYAIDTFNALQLLEPNALWYWIVGNDAFQSLPRWRSSQSLVTQCIWLVAPRKAEDEGRTGWEEASAVSRQPSAATQPPPLSSSTAHLRSSAARVSATQNSSHPITRPPQPSIDSTAPQWHQLDMPSVGISSSLIRQRCREGRSIRYWVPEAVHSYIAEQNLYQMS
jgi:nicotinate-nucleotide adenylyltransferase